MIACLGVFGLAAYITQQRTKEIGIRKVFGADAWGILFLLTKDFVRLAVVAFIISTPLAYIGLQHWLEEFAYHTQVGFGVLVLAGLGILVIALLTVSFHASKASRLNPVESLRYE